MRLESAARRRQCFELHQRGEKGGFADEEFAFADSSRSAALERRGATARCDIRTLVHAAIKHQIRFDRTKPTRVKPQMSVEQRVVLQADNLTIGDLRKQKEIDF